MSRTSFISEYVKFMLIDSALMQLLISILLIVIGNSVTGRLYEKSVSI